MNPGRIVPSASGRSAIVTGGSSGIGYAAVDLLVSKGYDVTIAARNRDRLDAAATRLAARGVPTDVTHDGECESLVASHIRACGRLDVLVHAAGVSAGGTVDDIEVAVWDDQQASLARSVFVLTRAALPSLRESGGLIVGIGSLSASGRVPGLSAYSAAKATAANFLRTVYAENRKFGVRATTINPGFVDTPLTRESTRSPMSFDEMIRPTDCALCLELLLNLGGNAHIAEIDLSNHGRS